MWTYPILAYRVVDGDTIEATMDQGFNGTQKEVLRLHRIDCPERHDKNGSRATEYLKMRMRFARELHVRTIKNKRNPETEKQGSFHRYLAELWADDANLNDVMVQEGLATYREGEGALKQ